MVKYLCKELLLIWHKILLDLIILIYSIQTDNLVLGDQVEKMQQVQDI